MAKKTSKPRREAEPGKKFADAEYDDAVRLLYDASVPKMSEMQRTDMYNACAAMVTRIKKHRETQKEDKSKKESKK